MFNHLKATGKAGVGSTLVSSFQSNFERNTEDSLDAPKTAMIIRSVSTAFGESGLSLTLVIMSGPMSSSTSGWCVLSHACPRAISPTSAPQCRSCPGPRERESHAARVPT